MLKMFHREALPGGLAGRWEQHWQASSLADAVRFCEIDPLVKILSGYMRPGTRILEGGCGLGQYVVHYHRQGYRIIGVDFAYGPLSRLKQLEPTVPVSVANVVALPFPDRSIDIYISNGVVEHFEHGPGGAILEARRVLKDNGLFLVSVPDASPLRRWMFRRPTTLRRADDGSATAAVVKTGIHSEQIISPAGDMRFFQYCYRRKEFENILRASGFSTIRTVGYSVVHGLIEVPAIKRLFDKAAQSQQPAGQSTRRNSNTLPQPVWKTSVRHMAKRALVAEDERLWVLAPLVKALKSLAPNMRMYVCTKIDLPEKADYG